MFRAIPLRCARIREIRTMSHIDSRNIQIECHIFRYSTVISDITGGLIFLPTQECGVWFTSMPLMELEIHDYRD